MSLKKNELYPCDICTKEVTHNFRVICPFCNVEICESCFQYSITMDLKTPCCVYCKKTLSLEFVLGNNETNWCKKIFIPFFENLCLEKEKSYLIDTMPKYKKMLEIREVRNEIKNLPSNYKIEKETFEQFIKENNIDQSVIKEIGKSNLKKDKAYLLLLNNKLDVKNKKKEILNDKLCSLEGNYSKKIFSKKKIVYVSNCPKQKCRGFVTDKYNCEICDIKICKLCMVEEKDNHNCNRDDIESAQLIKESSKPCPKCFVPIFKISGCNQMFCTNCHVVFDWITLKIDNGKVHNVHYFDWMTSQNNSKNINLEEIACGDIIEIYRNLMFQYNNNSDYVQTLKIKKMFQINRVYDGEIIDEIRNKLIKNKFEDYRIEYLDNKISEKAWKSKIAKDTINNERYKSLIEIYEMYVTVTSDFIRQLAFKEITILELFNKYFEFFKFFEKAIDETFDIFGGNICNKQLKLINEAKCLY